MLFSVHFLDFNERQTSEYSQFSNYNIDRRNLFVSGLLLDLLLEEEHTVSRYLIL